MPTTVYRDQPIFHQAWRLTFPILLAYFPLGAVFGVLFVHQGYAWYWAPIMSLLVYGGSIQFVAIAVMALGGDWLHILIPSLMLSLRNTFYGLSFLERFKGVLWYQKLYLMHGLVDATYALLLSHRYKERAQDRKFCLAMTFLLQVYWVLGTLAGAVFGRYLPNIAGLAFVLTCFFMVMVIDQYYALKTWKPFIIAACTLPVAYFISAPNMTLLAILLSVMALFFMRDSTKVDE